MRSPGLLMGLEPQRWHLLAIQFGIQLEHELGYDFWNHFGDRHGLGFQFEDELEKQLKASLNLTYSQVQMNLEPQLGNPLEDQLLYQLDDQLGVQLWNQLWSQFEDQLRYQLWSQLEYQLRYQLCGQLWSQLHEP